MADKKMLVGKRVNLNLLAKELEKNNHKLKVCDFMNLFYITMSELEEHHPVIQQTMKDLGEQAYNDYICSVVFSLCVRLASATLSEEAFKNMVNRISSEDVELEKEPTDTKELN